MEICAIVFAFTMYTLADPGGGPRGPGPPLTPGFEAPKLSFLGPLLIVLYFFFSLASLGILFHSYLTIFHNLNSKFF